MTENYFYHTIVSNQSIINPIKFSIMSIVWKGLVTVFLEVACSLGLLKAEAEKDTDGEKKSDSGYDPDDLYDPTPRPIDYGTMP